MVLKRGDDNEMGEELEPMKVYFRSGDKFAEVSTIQTITETATDDCNVKNTCGDVFSTQQRFTWIIKINKEDKEKIMAELTGFKSVAAMHRYSRRIKRQKEKDRRARLKHEARNNRP